MQSENIKLLRDVDKAQQRGNCLRDYCSVSAAFHSHAEDNDEYDIQNHIDHRRNDQEIQRGFAVPQRAQHCGQSIIGAGREQSRVNNRHVQLNISQQFLRSVHQPQNRFIRNQKSHRHNHSEENAQINRHRNIMPHLL